VVFKYLDLFESFNPRFQTKTQSSTSFAIDRSKETQLSIANLEQRLISEGVRLDEKSQVIDSICLENVDVTRPEEVRLNVAAPPDADSPKGVEPFPSVFIRPKVFTESSKSGHDEQVIDQLNAVRRLLLTVL